MFSLQNFLFYFAAFDLVNSVYIQRHILESLSRKAVQVAKCRSSCLATHLGVEETILESCQGECRTCWDACKSFSETTFHNVQHPDCKQDLGCETAKRVLLEQETRTKNSVKHGSSSKSQPMLKFSAKPLFTYSDCSVSWNHLELRNLNSLPRSIEPDYPPVKIIFLLFGRDQGDRWYELGQTFLTQMSFLPVLMDKMSEVRIMAVSAHGVVDVSVVQVAGCTTHTSKSEPFHSSSENVSGSTDNFFVPLVITCGCLAASCLAVVTLLIKFLRKKSTSKNVSGLDFYSLNNHSTMKLNVKNINTSIEIYEDDTTLPIYTIFGGKDIEGSLQNLDLVSDAKEIDAKLKAHVCYSKCGLGPEYLQYVHNTIM